MSEVYSSLRGDLPDEVSRRRTRQRVLRALESASPRSGSAGRRWWIGLPAVAVAAALVVGALGIIAYRGGPMATVDPVLRIQANGGVHLRWNDVGKPDYDILRSTTPADFSRAYRRKVRGTDYLDREPTEAPVVYYRVE